MTRQAKGRGLLWLMFAPIVACIALAIITGAVAFFVFAAIAWAFLMGGVGWAVAGYNTGRVRR